MWYNQRIRQDNNNFRNDHHHQPCSIQSNLNYSTTQKNNVLILTKKRRVKSLLLLSFAAFLSVIFLDGVVQLTYIKPMDPPPPGYGSGSGRFLTDTIQEQHSINNNPNNNNRRSTYHRLPLLPKHALQHRRRRELISRQKPLPAHLRFDHQEAESRRKRIYPALSDDFTTVVDRRKSTRTRRRRNQEQEKTLYETGALYQGYGTHYIDLWIGSPPQRQTVIVDTGSSVTAFPCGGCNECGSTEGGKLRFHLDQVFEKEQSSTYSEVGCGDNSGDCGIGVCTADGGSLSKYCKLAVAYAEGSTWTAMEGSDVVYPGGPHEFALGDDEEEEGERMENGVGVGMADFGGENKGKFEWDEFRLGFGCQTKVTGLFQTQLEDGIMGMDNRKGAFWLQLRDHYKNMGYVHDPNDPFDPSQFSLCYDRQPMSSNLEVGVGSGSLTIGGSDPILHGTPMVFAENVTPIEGWYTVKIKGLFLRSRGGTLADPFPDANEVKYIRVDADEKDLNGAIQDGTGPIVDSGTTDTYLSSSLKGPFNEAWKKAIGPDAEYSNEAVHLTPEQVHALPTVLVVLRGHISNAQHQSSQGDNDLPVGMVGHPNHVKMLQLNSEDRTLNSISPNDVIVAIPPEHYMEESSKEKGRYTSRLYFTERMGDRSVLGSNFIMGHEVLFDNTAGRLGFAESHCDYERYIAEKGDMLQALINEGKKGEEEMQQMNVQQVASEVAAALVDGQQQQVAEDVSTVEMAAAAAAASVQQVQQAPAADQVDAPQQASANQVGLDAVATGIVEGNIVPQESIVPEGAAAAAAAAAPQQDVALGGDDTNSLAASGWSRKTREMGGLRQEIRIPG